MCRHLSNFDRNHMAWSPRPSHPSNRFFRAVLSADTWEETSNLNPYRCPIFEAVDLYVKVRLTCHLASSLVLEAERLKMLMLTRLKSRLTMQSFFQSCENLSFVPCQCLCVHHCAANLITIYQKECIKEIQGIPYLAELLW